ncbi:MAG: hypothetical protein PHY72_03290 [Candidatus Pacebacteria bacterium]|nr:hypothetical protein [Candidatus Paceibacterota bacterium]
MPINLAIAVFFLALTVLVIFFLRHRIAFAGIFGSSPRKASWENVSRVMRGIQEELKSYQHHSEGFIDDIRVAQRVDVTERRLQKAKRLATKYGFIPNNFDETTN